MKLSNHLLSLLITVGFYILFFGIISFEDGDESNNSLIPAGATIAMTFFINFPIVWWITYKLVKEIRKNTNH